METLTLLTVEELFCQYVAEAINKNQTEVLLRWITVSDADIEMTKKRVENTHEKYQVLAQQFLQIIRIKYAIDYNPDDQFDQELFAS